MEKQTRAELTPEARKEWDAGWEEWKRNPAPLNRAERRAAQRALGKQRTANPRYPIFK